MNVEPWVLAAAALFLFGHAVVLLFVYRLRTGDSLWSRATAGETADTVSCRECGAPNGGEYRFCRQCTAELPGRLAGDEAETEPDSQGML
jgi:ribosomal protein L40E